MNATAPVLPDEDLLAFPESWNRFVQPRRGRGRPKRLRLDPEAGRALLAEHGVRERLGDDANADYRDAGLAFLAGEADPVGAAAVMALARSDARTEPYLRRALFDLAAADHGLPFAAVALIEFLAIDLPDARSGTAIGLAPQSLQNHRWRRLNMSAEFAAIRGHLAGLPDAEYAAVTDALAARRTDPLRRFAVSLLVPWEGAWLDEVCAEHRAQRPDAAASNLLIGVVTTAEQLDGVDVGGVFAYWFQTAGIADLLHRLGPDAVPVIEAMFTSWLGADGRKTLYRALAAAPSDAAIGLILDRLDDPAAMGSAMEAAARFPQRALRAVAARLPGAEPAERKRLTALLHSDPVILGAALERQTDAVRAAVAEAAGTADRLPAAAASDLPALITDPPWSTGRTTPAQTVLKGLVPPPIHRVDWAEGEREAWAAAETPRGDCDWDEAVKGWERASIHFRHEIIATAPPRLTADLLPGWDPAYVGEDTAKRILAVHGDAVAERIAAAAGSDASLRGLLLPIVNLTAARLAADALVRLKTMRPLAFEWLDRHADAAAALLVPDALGKAKRLRAAAEGALRYVAANGRADAVRAAAAAHGPEATAAIEALVDVDPLTPAVPLPAIGPWVAPHALPQILLPGGERALPDAAVRNVAAVLALGSPDYDYPGVAVLAAACDRASLARFSDALFEQWLVAGAPWDESWALMQLMHFGDDDTVRALTPLIGRWPGENQHHRAVKGLRVLGAIGSETALRALQGIGERAKFAAIKQEARDQTAAIAAKLGLSAEQLADRLVPDFGLRGEGALVLDYGPRSFRVGFDERLKPFVTDADGVPRKSLPKPAAKDDAVLADAAYKRFANLRKELRTVAADQVKRFERAMVTGRTWTSDEFQEHCVDHPLVWHLARRLLWTADDGSGPVAFRLSEDRGRADVNENGLATSGSATIGIAHPVHLGADVAAWSEVFADYEIVQPFPQLGREVMAFTEEELATGHVARFEQARVDVGGLLGLVKKGWVRAGALDAGIEHGMWCELPGTGYLVLDLDPGINTGDVHGEWSQCLAQVAISRSDMSGWTRAQATPGLTVTDPIAVSEALTALAKVVEAGGDR